LTAIEKHEAAASAISGLLMAYSFEANLYKDICPFAAATLLL